MANFEIVGRGTMSPQTTQLIDALQRNKELALQKADMELRELMQKRKIEAAKEDRASATKAQEALEKLRVKTAEEIAERQELRETTKRYSAQELANQGEHFLKRYKAAGYSDEEAQLQLTTAIEDQGKVAWNQALLDQGVDPRTMKGLDQFNDPALGGLTADAMAISGLGGTPQYNPLESPEQRRQIIREEELRQQQIDQQGEGIAIQRLSVEGGLEQGATDLARKEQERRDALDQAGWQAFNQAGDLELRNRALDAQIQNNMYQHIDRIANTTLQREQMNKQYELEQARIEVSNRNAATNEGMLESQMNRDQLSREEFEENKAQYRTAAATSAAEMLYEITTKDAEIESTRAEALLKLTSNPEWTMMTETDENGRPRLSAIQQFYIDELNKSFDSQKAQFILGGQAKFEALAIGGKMSKYSINALNKLENMTGISAERRKRAEDFLKATNHYYKEIDTQASHAATVTDDVKETIKYEYGLGQESTKDILGRGMGVIRTKKFGPSGAKGSLSNP